MEGDKETTLAITQQLTLERSIMTESSTLNIKAGKYTIDKVHSSVSFVIRHMVAAKVRGRFNDFDGTLDIAETLEDSNVDVNIVADSVDTGNEQRDGHLKSADFFEAESNKVITFVSTKLEISGGNEGKLFGDLTIRGNTLPVVLDVEYLGTEKNPYGKTVLGFSATTEINREDFGVSWNTVLETGGLMVGKTVKIEIDVEAQLEE